MAGIEAIQAASQEHMSAAWRIPLVKLTGISPRVERFDEGEIRVYYDLIHSEQEAWLRPILQIVMDLCSIELFGDVDSDITFDFIKLFEVTELEAAQIRTADAQTGSLLIQEQVISTEEERGRVADDPDSPYVDLDPLKPPHALQPQPGEEGYQAQPDAWTQTFSHIADTGGLLPAPDGEPGSSNQAWSQIMGGITATGGLGHEDDGVLASPEAWGHISAGLAGSGGVAGREPPQKLLGPPLAKVFGGDAPGKATDGQYAAALGMDDFNPEQPRVGAGEKGGGEWTSGGGSAAPSGEKDAPPSASKASAATAGLLRSFRRAMLPRNAHKEMTATSASTPMR